MPTRQNDRFLRAAMLAFASASVLVACSSLPKTTRTCTTVTDCLQGEECRLASSTDAKATCQAITYDNPKTGGFGTDCSLASCNGTESPCATGFACYFAANKCDPNAICTQGCSSDTNCPSDFYCSDTSSATVPSGIACTKSSDCAADSFCAVERDNNGNPAQLCEKKTCLPRQRCTECGTDEQCRGSSLQQDWVCSTDELGGRFCTKPCNSDLDCLKPYKTTDIHGTPISYKNFDTCQNGACVPSTGACHGKSTLSGQGDNSLCSTCRVNVPSDCSGDLFCIQTDLQESFCTQTCTIGLTQMSQGYQIDDTTNSCPTGTYCYPLGVPSGCGAHCTTQGYCSRDNVYGGLTCSSPPG